MPLVLMSLGARWVPALTVSRARLQAAGPEEGAARTVPVVDLVLNGGFEEPSRVAGRPRFWSPIPGGLDISSPILAKHGYDETIAHGGSRSVALSSLGDRVAKRPSWSQIVALKGAACYRARGFVRARSCARAGIVIQLLDADGGRIREITVGSVEDTAGRWQELAAEFDTPMNAAQAKIQCVLGQTGEVWFDDIGLAEVEKARRWTFEMATYPSRQIDHALSIDGQLDDWPDLYAARLARLPLPDERTDGEIADSERNLLRCCHDDNRLYLAVVLTKTDLPRQDDPYFLGDSIQVALDPGFERSRKPDSDDLVFGLALAGEARERAAQELALAFHQEHPTWRAVDATAIERAVTFTGDRVVYELALPWRLVGIRRPDAHPMIGLSLRGQVREGEKLRRWHWGGGMGARIDPSGFGRIVLLVPGSGCRLMLTPSRSRVGDLSPICLDLRVASELEQAGRQIRVSFEGNGAGLSQELVVAAHRGLLAMPVVVEAGALAPGPVGVAAELLGPGGEVLDRAWSSLEIVPYAARTEQVEAQWLHLRDEMRRLRDAIRESRQRGVNTEAAEISLAVAEGLADGALYDNAILDFQQVAERQLRDLRLVVEQAVAVLRDHPSAVPGYLEPDLATLTVTADGQFSAAGRPVFLSGFVNQPCDSAITVPFVKRLGVNLLGVWTDLRLAARGMNEFRLEGVLDGLTKIDSVARENNCRVDILLGHGLDSLAWLRRRYPDLRGATGHFIEYDIDHPAAREIWRNYLTEITPRLAALPSVLSLDLANEPKFPQASRYTADGFRFWLRGQYGGIESLNGRWGTSFADFEACRPGRPPARVSPAARFDWCLYNRIRVTRFFADLARVVEARAPRLLTHVKIVGEDMFFPATQANGIDRDMLSEVTTINGTDVRPIPEPQWTPFDASIDWLGQTLALDYMKSTRPDRPIFDSEWHVCQTVRYRDGGEIPPAHVETALWLAHLHGMSANLTWYWSRQNGPEHPTWGDFAKFIKGSFLLQPLLVDAYARAMLRLRRRAREVVSLVSAPRPIRYFYSRASAIQDPRFTSRMWLTYGAANFLGRGLGFLNERQIEAGELAGCRVLIVANARFTTDEVAARIREYAATGGLVILVGNDNLTRDPWGERRSEWSLSGPSVRVIEEIDARDGEGMEGAGASRPGEQAARHQFEQLAAVLESELPLAEPALVGVDGRPEWGLETRTVKSAGGTLLYGINLTTRPLKLRLHAAGRSVTWLEGGPFAGPTIELPPRLPVLLRVE